MAQPSVRHIGSRGDGAVYSDEAVAEIQSRILGLCAAAGLALADSEDLAQDVWEWLLRRRCPPLALAAPWLNAVVHNYLLRYRRRLGRYKKREGVALEFAREPEAAVDAFDFETNEALDRIAGVLPRMERNLLALIRNGYTLAKAADELGIPRGSRAYYGGRLVRLARREIRAGVRGPGGAHGRMPIRRSRNPDVKRDA